MQQIRLEAVPDEEKGTEPVQPPSGRLAAWREELKGLPRVWAVLLVVLLVAIGWQWVRIQSLTDEVDRLTVELEASLAQIGAYEGYVDSVREQVSGLSENLNQLEEFLAGEPSRSKGDRKDGEPEVDPSEPILEAAEAL